MSKNLKIYILIAAFFFIDKWCSYREISNLNDILKGFIIEVDKDIKENNLMININEENDLVTIKLMRALIIKLIWWN